MDRDAFDDVARRFAASPSRRAVLGALLGGALAGVISGPGAAKRRRKPRRPKATPDAGPCAHPGRSSHLDRCDFDRARFEGIDLSSSSMRGTRFRGADLCGANLDSSRLQEADFRDANLTKATLRSSACARTDFSGVTLCGTVMCDGSVRDDDCPPGVDPADVCCGRAGCGPGHVCCDRRCQPGNCCSSADCGKTAFCVDGTCRACAVCANGCQFSSVGEAVRLAVPGSTIYVCPGRYFGGFTVPNHLIQLTIVGAGSGNDGTILDGSHDESPNAHVVVGADVTLRDLKISGHKGEGVGGGLLTADFGRVTLQRVRIEDNRAQQGGGIFNYGEAILEAGTVITGNTATLGGGGVYTWGILRMRPGSVMSGNSRPECIGPGQGCPSGS